MAALLALVPAGAGGTLPAHAASDAAISYVLGVGDPGITLCTGESAQIDVTITRQVQLNGETHLGLVAGGAVHAAISDPSILHFEPRDPSRAVVGQPQPKATYKVVADKFGRTKITFEMRGTGEEATMGGGWPTTDNTVDVDVTDCYLANTSSLASIFDSADMGGIDEPFLLTGHTPNQNNLKAITQVMFFVPDEEGDHRSGIYALVDVASSTLPGQTGQCITSISGDYEVIFYIPPPGSAPDGGDVGDLRLKGEGTSVCGGFPLALHYQATPGFHISFKPKVVTP